MFLYLERKQEVKLQQRSRYDKGKIKEISNKLIEFACYIEQRAELNEDVADYKYQYYYEQLLEIRDDLSEMQDAWWSAKSN